MSQEVAGVAVRLGLYLCTRSATDSVISTYLVIYAGYYRLILRAPKVSDNIFKGWWCSRYRRDEAILLAISAKPYFARE